jgi:eukaryotic-like serine/threonine-protein kinase
MGDNQKYRVTDKIDAGGMAEVYRGISESAIGGIKKAVAIKKILPTLTKNKKFIQMFLDEARVTMHLQHANIVGVFDIGMADTAYFIVMEYVDGANLKTIIESLRRQGQRMPLAHVVYVMMEVCKGLQYAHDATDPDTGRELGIVHRDISPPNILISKRGEVKLVDFGLAKATSQLETTDPGVVKGKFSYLAPEAANGKEVDRRADVFAVGILLYELLTGKRLFFGETDYQTIELVRQAKVPPIAPQNQEVSPELEQIIRRALARDVTERYASAADLQEALAQFLFSQRLKVTSRDVEQLVQACLREKQRSQPQIRRNEGSIIDTLINEEILKFTSLDNLEGGSSGTSPSPVGEDGNAPLDPGLFVDTRGWADDVGGERARNGAGRPRSDSSAQIENLEDLLEGDGASIPASSRVAQPLSGKNTPRPPGATGRISGVSRAIGNDFEGRPEETRRTGNGSTKIILVAMLVLIIAGAGAVYAFRDRLLGLVAPPAQKR